MEFHESLSSTSFLSFLVDRAKPTQSYVLHRFTMIIAASSL